MAGKVNPRRRPVSQADIQHAKTTAFETAFRASVTIILSALLDGGFLSPDTVQDAWRAVNDRADSVHRGYCSLPDLEKVLREEYGVR